MLSVTSDLCPAPLPAVLLVCVLSFLGVNVDPQLMTLLLRSEAEAQSCPRVQESKPSLFVPPEKNAMRSWEEI